MDQRIKPEAHSEAGFSLVAVLMIMGIVLMSILLVSQARFKQQGVQKTLKSKQSYGDVNQALINSVVEVIHKGLLAPGAAGACPAITTLVPHTNMDGGSGYTVSQSFSPKITANSPLPADHDKAIKRCATPGITNSDQRLYFCVKLDKDPKAPIDSILNAESAFAEFAIELIDLQTNTAIDCKEYHKRASDVDPLGLPGSPSRDGSAGMAVTMALYWETQQGTNKYNFSQKALSYIANQN